MLITSSLLFLGDGASKAPELVFDGHVHSHCIRWPEHPWPIPCPTMIMSTPTTPNDRITRGFASNFAFKVMRMLHSST